MAESTTPTTTTTFTPYATLSALGLYLGQIDFLAPVRDQVKIAQKKLVYTPFDSILSIIAGATGGRQAKVW